MTNKKSKKKMPLMLMLLLVGMIPLIVCIITTLLVTLEKLRSTVSYETMLRLKTIATDTKNYFGVDWLVWMENGISEDDEIYVDEHVDENIEITIFKGDTRYISSIRDSSGSRISGTKASDTVIAAVLNGGQDYSARDVMINNAPYFVYYTPIIVEGETVGMAFAGEKMENFEAEIAGTKNNLISLAGISILFWCVLVILISIKLRKPFVFITKALGSLATGKLDTSFECSTALRETTEIIEYSAKLRDELSNIVGSIKSETIALNDNAGDLIKIASSTNTNIENCNNAVLEIAQGAQASATDTEAIATQCMELERISSNVSDAMHEMKKSADEALEISSNAKDTMTSLENVSGETQAIVDDIASQMHAVNSRLSDVGSIVTAISDITSQTNLLSLNASIEAARAGEAGRGFAVVANEIRSLADSSAQNANKINDIINGLVNEIKQTTELTEKLVSQSADQVKQLNATGDELDKCIEEINMISGNVDTVNTQTQGLNDATHAVNNAVTNLSAVTQQNSASAQETTAAMHESSVQVSHLNGNAKDVASISDKLKNLVAYFKDEDQAQDPSAPAAPTAAPAAPSAASTAISAAPAPTVTAAAVSATTVASAASTVK